MEIVKKILILTSSLYFKNNKRIPITNEIKSYNIESNFNKYVPCNLQCHVKVTTMIILFFIIFFIINN